MSDENLMATVSANFDGENLRKGADQAVKDLGRISDAHEKMTQQITADDKIRIEQEKRLTGVTKKLADERVVLARNEGKRIDKEKQENLAKERKNLEDTRSVNYRDNVLFREQERRKTTEQRQARERNLVVLREDLRKEREVRREGRAILSRDERAYQSIVNRALSVSPELRQRVGQAIGGAAARGARNRMVAEGMTMREAFRSQLTGWGGQFSEAEGSFLAGISSTRPVSFGGVDREAIRLRRQQEKDERKAQQESAQYWVARLRNDEQLQNEYQRQNAAYWMAKMRFDERQQKEEDKAQKRRQREQLADLSKQEAEQAGYWLRVIREREKEKSKRDRAARQVELQQERDITRDQRLIARVTNRAMIAPLEMQQRIAAILSAPGAAAQRANMLSVGATPVQALHAQLGAGGLSAEEALFLSGGGGRRPPTLGGRTPAAAGGGGRGGAFRRIGGQIFRSAAAAVGFGVSGFGAYAAVQAGRSLVESTQLATAYERQRVAAEGLAGGQARLNQLLEAYNEASGGAVDNVTALDNVTRLLATGYAKTVPEAERFVRATRGASIALGRPQEEVTQETQLAISNTSVKRLDQIGLGIEEVTNRVEHLRSTNANWSREMAFQEAVLSVMEQKYGHLTDTVEGQATGVERLRKSWLDFRLTMGQSSQEGINKTAEALARLVKVMDDVIARNEKLRQDRAYVAGENPIILPGGFILPSSSAPGIDLGRFTASSSSRDRSRHPSGRLGRLARGHARFEDEELSSIRDFEERASEIERQYQEARLNETEQYEQQRTSIIRNYEKQMAREAEDFAIQRSRAARDYQKQREDILEDAAKRDERLTEDYTEAVTEKREDSEKRIQELNEEYQEEREKAAKDHQDRLLSAAGQLNAIAVLEERKRWRRENEERDKAHREQVEAAREALDEQLEEAREAYEERLQDAREADQERLDDMEESRRQQMEDEDADRALRLERAKEDHDDQLAELDRQHGLRLKQIEDQAEDEREAWNKEFEDLLVSLGIYVAGLTEKRKKMDELAEGWFDKQVELLEEKLAGITRDLETTPRNTYDKDSAVGPRLSYGSGGRVHQTGPAILHAGEYVLSTGMLAGTQPVPAGIANAISNSKHIEVGGVVVQVMPGMEQYVGELLEEQLADILDRVG